MQIHELNNYGGNLNDAFFAADNGFDTGKVTKNQIISEAISGLEDANARIDNLLEGLTVDSEVIDARLGANGVTYPSLGAAIRGQFTEVNNELAMIETADIALTANSAWDDSKTKPTPTPVTGYTRSSQVIRYIPGAEFEVTADGIPYFIYYDSAMNKAGTCRYYTDIPASAGYFVFYGSAVTNLTSAKISIYLPISYKNRIEAAEADIDLMKTEKEESLHSDAIGIVSDSAWDDSKTTPTTVAVPGYTRSKDVLVFNKDAILTTNAAPANLRFIYFDADKTKMGTAYQYSDIPANAVYFVFYCSSAVSISEAAYSYYVRANSVPAGMITEIIVGESTATKVGSTASIPAATSLTGGYMSAADKRKLDDLVPGDISITGSGIAKNASAYGFLPTNDGLTNAQNLQSVINGGGTIIVDLAGTYDISRTIKIPSNTTILFGANVYLERTTENSYFPKYVFINSGIFDGDYNENITIKGLKIIPGTITGNPDISAPELGLRGLVVMAKVENLVIDGFEVIDHTYSDYGIQVTFFKNAILKNIHIESLKDGVHFGTGDGFTLSHCRFLTNDDCIALNAVDYPASNYGTGDIKNGIIEDITLLSAAGTSMARKRGIFMLSGAWKEWVSGNSYQVYGDYCVNNGKLYQTYGNSPSTATLISTNAPTHASGAQTYPDGLTWVMKQAEDVGLSANIKNITFRNIYVAREVASLFMFSSEMSEYLRSVYPTAELKANENIVIDNVQPLSETPVNISAFMGVYNPIDKIVVKDSNFVNIANFIIFSNGAGSIPMASLVNMAFIGNYYGFEAPFYAAASSNNLPEVVASICGSMVSENFVFRNSVVQPKILFKDI